MATLTRRNGTQVTFSTAELTTILGSLRLSGQARAFDRDVAFMSTETGLLLGDTSWNVGLRLAETFEVRSADTLPFGLAFFADEARYDVQQALATSGYVLGVRSARLLGLRGPSVRHFDRLRNVTRFC